MRRELLTVAETAELLRCTPRHVGDLARAGRIPHRKFAGTKASLFPIDELEAWIDGAELEVVDTNGAGGRIVRPVGGAA